MRLPAEMAEMIIEHCRDGLPNEACGLLAGDADEVRRVYLLENVDASPVSFTIDPIGHFEALRDAEQKGWELIGAFHSHVSAPPYPSPTDVAGAAEPEWTWLVVGPMVETPEIRGFCIRRGEISEHELAISTR